MYLFDRKQIRKHYCYKFVGWAGSTLGAGHEKTWRWFNAWGLVILVGVRVKVRYFCSRTGFGCYVGFSKWKSADKWRFGGRGVEKQVWLADTHGRVLADKVNRLLASNQDLGE